jgi:hypothetical protein
MSDKMREEFSAWYLADATQSYGESVRPQAEKNLAWRRQDGSFADPMLRLACLAWQASRESLVIELPKPWQTNVGAMLTPNGVRFAIESAGLKVKP